jgi:hypothetical protein
MTRPKIGREEPWRSLELKTHALRSRLRLLEEHDPARDGDLRDEIAQHQEQAAQLLVVAEDKIERAERDPNEAWQTAQDELSQQLDNLEQSVESILRRIGLI